MALANAYYGNILRASSAQISDESSPEINYTVNNEGETNKKGVKIFAPSQSSSISSPCSTNSSGYNNLMHRNGAPKNDLQHEETHSLVNFKNGYNNFVHGGGSNGSFLNFEQNEQSPPNFSPKMSHQNEHSFWDDLNCAQSSRNSYGFINNTKEGPEGEVVPFGWNNSETNGVSSELQTKELTIFNKRPLSGESTQSLKRQCSTSATKKQPKPKSTPSKDPQSIAAKNRRERISERLKVLQELVPNGSKVDLVTMLEKAIGYVKFLQLQVKVLAADEFWPAQGGRAPDLSQVKEALDAILSTQRDRNSCSN